MCMLVLRLQRPSTTPSLPSRSVRTQPQTLTSRVRVPVESIQTHESLLTILARTLWQCDGGAGSREAQIAEQGDVEHRVEAPSLPGKEHRRADRGDGEAADRGRSRPATIGSFDDREHERAHG